MKLSSVLINSDTERDCQQCVLTLQPKTPMTLGYVWNQAETFGYVRVVGIQFNR